jgi:hypothetical protein
MPLSRIAGEGAERSEAGEGQAVADAASLDKPPPLGPRCRLR